MTTTADNSQPMCDVCVEPFPSTRNGKVTHSCGFTCCYTCFVTWLQDVDNALTCMSCKEHFTESGIVSITSERFARSIFRPVLKEILFRGERALIQIAKKENALVAVKESLMKQAKQHSIGDPLEFYFHMKSLGVSINDIVDCPNPECDKFIFVDKDVDTVRCIKCRIIVCSKCLAICSRDEFASKHMCDPIVAADAIAVEDDTIACPSCFVRVFKDGGCFQVMCTNCNTVFNYETGKVERGYTHAVDAVESVEHFINSSIPEEVKLAKQSKWIEHNVHVLQYDTFDNQFSYVVNNNKAMYSLVRMIDKASEWIKKSLNKLNHARINAKSRSEFVSGTISEQSFKTKLYNAELSYRKTLALAHDIAKFHFHATDLVNRYLLQLITDQGELLHGAIYVELDNEEDVGCEITDMLVLYGDYLKKTHKWDLFSLAK